MCFTAEMSAVLTLIGVSATATLYKFTRNRRLCIAMLYFCLMEALQAVQQWSPSLATSLDDPRCRLRMNQVLNVLGYAHIMFQPYFTNLMHQSGKAGVGKEREWEVVKRLCLASGLLGMLRLVFVFHGASGPNREDLAPAHAQFLETSKDWIEAPQACMYKGAVHLAWALPLPRPTYLLGGLGTHSLLMFAPALCVSGLQGLDGTLFLIFTGPVLASMIAPGAKLEQASIWCFFSIAQICIGGVSAMLDQRAEEAKNAPKAPAKKQVAGSA